MRDVLSSGGAFFFRQLSEAVHSTDDGTLVAVLWDLVWAGLVGNDTLAPLRSLVGGGRPSRRSRPMRPPRSRYARGRPALPVRGGPPIAAGRWSLLPARDPDPTRRAHAAAEGLLDRHGVVTRGAVVAERLPGGFAAAYRVLSAFEDSGRARRGYFVAGLGAAQFAPVGAVDRLRAFADTAARREPVPALVLAATDPANPYGAALPWPDRDQPAAIDPAVRQALSSCSSTASSCSTSNAAAAPCSRGPTTPIVSAQLPTHSPWPSGMEPWVR